MPHFSPGRRGQAGKSRAWFLAALLLAATSAGLWWWTAQTGPAAPRAGGPGPSPSATASRGSAGARRFGGAGGTGGAGSVQPVSVQAARRQDIRVSVNANGAIAALNTAVVRVQVSGVLQGLKFREGQQVKAGQWLAQLDPRAFEAALAQAEGALARDEAQIAGARVDLARYRDLLTKDAIAKQQLDSQVALVGQLAGSVKLDQAAVQTARLQLSYTRVTAPISGRVGLKQLDIGNVAQPTDANGIVSITQTQPVVLVFAVPASNVPALSARLRKGEPVAVTVSDSGGRTQLALGQVAALDNAIDPTTDTIRVKALFANTDEALYPNQAVNVSLEINKLSHALAVPQAAVLRGAQGFYVYVVNANNTVSTRVVHPGAVDANWMAIDGAVQPGDKVVIDGTDRLREGAKVEVIDADPRQRAGAGAGAGAGVASAPAAGGRRGRSASN